MVAILPRGEAIRTFVYSGALDDVAQSARVTVMTVVPNSEIFEAIAARFDTVHELADAQEPRPLGALRDFIDMAHGRYLWSEAARIRWATRDAEATTFAAKAKRSLKKIACLPLGNAPGLDLLSRAEGMLGAKLEARGYYRDLFEAERPTLVFNGSHVHGRLALRAVHAARSLGIPTAAFIFSWDNLTSQGRIIPAYDYYLVWNAAIGDELLRIYPSVRREQVLVTGTPQFDFHFRSEYWWSREEFCGRVGADPNRPIALYTTGMPNHMPGEPDIVESIADALAAMTDLGPPQLLVRVYPKDSTGRFERLRARPDVLMPPVPWEPKWLTPKPEDAWLLTNTLRHADVGINIASTISLELCMLDRPVVNVGYQFCHSDDYASGVDVARYYAFEHYKPLVDAGAVAVASTPDHLSALVRRALVDPQADADRRRSLIASLFGSSLDGYCAVRVADRLARLARGDRATHA